MADALQDLLTQLASEGTRESEGRFSIPPSWEKLAKSHGLWADDYLAFLVQAIYLRGATYLKLRASARGFAWEWDGPPLEAEELVQLLPGSPREPSQLALRKLRLAVLLLSLTEYPRARLATPAGAELLLADGHGSVQAAARQTVQRLELRLPRLSMSWLCAPRSKLFVLPEMVALRPRLTGSPLRLEFPWRPARQEPVGLLTVVDGQTRSFPDPHSLGAGIVHRYKVPELPFACLHFPESGSRSRIFVHGLSYPLDDWVVPGALWLYCDGLSTDLCAKRLVQNDALHQVQLDATRILQECHGRPPDSVEEGLCLEPGRRR